MGKYEALSGNEAVATAMRQINPDVVAAYPITPQTSTVQKFADFYADGLVDTEFVTVESEHSAMSACIGASAAGARVMTATSSAGLAFMWEVLYIASSNRCPIVMSLVDRALSGPINIHCDHADVMGMRDSGWIILLSENGQEAYDNLIQAVRIGEHPNVLLPVAVSQDGFITSHSLERVEVHDDEAVKGFVGDFGAGWPLLDLENPKTYGAAGFHEYYYEFKRQQVEAMDRAFDVIRDTAREYNERFDRSYDLFESYRLEDAEVAVVVANSTAGTAKVVVDQLRDQGLRVGLLKPRVFRPFPGKEMVAALEHVKALGVMDRAVSFGAVNSAGPLFLEIMTALALRGAQVPVAGFIYGLGGRDIVPSEIGSIYSELRGYAESGEVPQPVQFIGVRE
jgi:pyruvate ferredoxin oxidoreductase alpha subunit